MIKRYHEAPLDIFHDVQKVTDGDYALVHLFEQLPGYLQAFEEAVASGRDVILDNSIFELGTAFDEDRYAEWIRRLKPTWYIVPDSWKNSRKTIEMFLDFMWKNPGLPGKVIGVAQGNTPEDVAETYLSLVNRCDMIAFNLDFSSYHYKMEPNSKAPYCLAMSLGRYTVLRELEKMGVIDPTKDHHLLGCGVPQEARWYTQPWIRSIDTSNPVMHGLFSSRYDPDVGIYHKPRPKMCDLMTVPVTTPQKEDIMYNIECMKRWCSYGTHD